MEKIIRGDAAIAKYDALRKEGNILGEFIVGSTAYGTNLPTSDIDKQFVYIDSLQDVLSGALTEKIELTKDYVGYEIGRFIELLAANNPNILDLTQPSEDCILALHPVYKKYIIDNAETFLTKKVKFSFASYATKQIKKARGENKKFMQPMEKERKGLLDFCWLVKGQGSQSLKEWLNENGIAAPACGVVALDHMKNCYNLFIDKGFGANDKPAYNGITDKDDVQIVLSSVPKGKIPEVSFYANIEGFSKYCKDYREYWDWMENRNEDRYQENVDNGLTYDGKNMAHCYRLLDMAIEILRDRKLNIRRTNREKLLSIRKGKYSYDELMVEAEEQMKTIEGLYLTSKLPEELESEFTQNILFNIRKEFYKVHTETVQFRGKPVAHLKVY